MTVQVIALAGDPGGRDRFDRDVVLHELPVPSVRGPAFFWEVHRLARERARAITARLYHASDLFMLPVMAKVAQDHNGALSYDSRELYTGLGAARRRPWASAFWYAVERRFILRASLKVSLVIR